MKKTIKSFIAIAATIAAFVSCAKEVSNPAGENGEKLIKLTIVANNPEAQPATRTEMNGSTPYWSVGDAIGVSNGTSTNYEFTTSITAASATASSITLFMRFGSIAHSSGIGLATSTPPFIPRSHLVRITAAASAGSAQA